MKQAQELPCLIVEFLSNNSDRLQLPYFSLYFEQNKVS